MQLIPSLLGARGLYKVKKRGQFIAELVYGGLAFFFVGAFILNSVPPTESGQAHVGIWLFVGLVLLYWGREAIQTNVLNKVLKAHVAMTQPSSSRFGEWHTYGALARQKPETTRWQTLYIDIQNSDAWCLYDVLERETRETRYATYLATESLHTVFEMKLQRVVPNVVFDNKHALGRQFRSSYVGSQRLSFEGNVDDIFDVYAPQSYQIDTLSFISPEVLDAMVNTTIPCDIEIINNRLICYAPALAVDQLETFKAECLNILHHFDDNLDTYRDDRLTGADRRKSITPFARRLLENPWRHWLAMILSGLGTAGILAAAAVTGDGHIVFNQLSVYVIIMFVGLQANAGRIWLKNRREKQRFQQLLNYTATDPAVRKFQGRV